MTENKVTGKKLLEDCAILARDLGAFVLDASKRAYAVIKNALTEKKEKASGAADTEKTGVTHATLDSDGEKKPTAAVG